jgi:multiple sugar transport system substrate-binding protein
MKKWLATILTLIMLLSVVITANAEANITITMMTVDSSDSAFLTSFIADYEANHPNVKIEHIATVNAELKKQVRIAALAGEMPDIISLDNPDFSSFAAGGYMLDITDMVAGWEDINQFYPAVLSAVTYKDRLYGIPREANCLGFYYNVDVLTNAGFDIPEGTWTWADVEEACKAVANLNNGTYGMAIAAPASEVGTFQFIPWLYSAGGNYKKLDSDAAVTAMTFLSDLIKNGYMSREVLNFSHGTLTNAFQGQQTAMMINGSWAITSLSDVDFNWKCTTIPVLMEGDASVTDLGGYHLGVTVDCQNPDIALDILKTMSSPKWEEEYAKYTGTLPTRLDVAKDSYWNEYPISVFVDSMQDAVSRVNVFWPELSVNIYNAMQAALSGEKDPATALSEAEAKNASYWAY